MCPSLLELCEQIERPCSPDKAETAAIPTDDWECGAESDRELSETEDFLDLFNLPYVSRPMGLPAPPLFDPPDLAMMYFDIYGTLIVCFLSLILYSS